MIIGFASKDTEHVWLGEISHKLHHDIQRVALRKLFMLDKAISLNDLRIPPANRLESLKGNRKGQHSVRINNQWRICFKWTENGPNAVEIVDYH